MITSERIKELLDYDPEMGEFSYTKLGRHNRKRPDKIGTMDSHGHLQVWLDGRLYQLHRIAWLYVYGHWPKELDHINMVKTDNRIANLREATRSQNMANKLVGRGNTSGFKGVHPKRGRYAAQISHNYRMLYLGLFDTPESAHAAYKEKAAELFGEFAR